MANLSTILRFGKCFFRVEAEDSRLVKTIESMFLHAEAQPGQDEIIIERIEQPEVNDETADSSAAELACAAKLINRLYVRHSGLIWIDAACLIAPSGASVLIVGPSGSGKSTLSLALGLFLSWRLLAEDTTLIDPVSNLVPPSAAPSGMRAGTAQRLSETCGLPLETFKRRSWFFEPNIFASQTISAKFDVAIALQPIMDAAEDFCVEEISISQLIRKILPNSNLVRGEHRIDLCSNWLETATCFSMRGGTLEQRLEFLKSQSQLGNSSYTA